MKTPLIAAAIAATSLSALADGATYDYPRPVVSNITRAEAVNKLKLAAANRALVSGERSYVASQTGRGLSRAEVRAALELAHRDGQLAHGEFGLNTSTGGTTGMRVAGR